MGMTRRAVMPLLFGLAASVTFGSTGAGAGAPAVYRVVNVAPWDALNLRAGPGTRYRIVGAIPHDGRAVESLFSRAGDWLQVRFGGQIGWVNGRYLAADAWREGGSNWRVVGVAENDVLNVRAGPSVRHPVTGIIPPHGRRVTMIGGCHGNWCRVHHRGTVGWVNTRHLAPDL